MARAGRVERPQVRDAPHARDERHARAERAQLRELAPPHREVDVAVDRARARAKARGARARAESTGARARAERGRDGRALRGPAPGRAGVRATTARDGSDKSLK